MLFSRNEKPKTSNQYNLPPGLQRNLAFYFLSRFSPKDPIRVFEHLARTYGPAAYYRIGPEQVLFINDPELIREVLVVQNDNFVKERTVRRMKMLVGDGLITSEADFWKRQRRMAQPAFHRQRIANYGDTMVRFAAESRDGWRDGETRDVSRDMMHLAMRIVAKTLFDQDLKREVEELAAQVNIIMGMYNLLVILPFADRLWHYPVPYLHKFAKARARLDETVYRLIREHHEENDRDRGDLLSMLMAAREEGSGNETSVRMSDEQLRDEIMTILLAGYETVANALTWTWYLLSQNLDAEARLHDEIDRVLGEGQKQRPATVADLPQLRYAEQVLAESMRLYPPAWAMGRRAINDFSLGPWRVPARTNVFMSQYVMHRTEKYWPDPLRFDPDRFTPENRQVRPKFTYFPFGGGPRQCIGESFAWMEGVLALATIAQRWRFRIVPDHRVELQPLITLRPKYGMKMTVEAR